MTKKARLSLFILSSLLMIGGVVYGTEREAEALFYRSLSYPIDHSASLQNAEGLFLERYSPIRKWNIPSPAFKASSVLAVEKDKNQTKVLFSKNAQHPFVIASLTKLMTAIVSIDHYSLDKIVVLDNAAIHQQGDNGLLKVGDKWRVKDLLRMSLMESSNESAYALAEVMEVPKFVVAMNQKASDISLNETRFVNPTGLEDAYGTNVASATDLAKIVTYILDHPRYHFLEQIMESPKFRLVRPNGSFHHLILNSNQLLGKLPYLKGGKTGYLPQYGGSLVAIFQQPKTNHYLITVVLDSPKRFLETEELVKWLSHAYFHLFNYYGPSSISDKH